MRGRLKIAAMAASAFGAAAIGVPVAVSARSVARTNVSEHRHQIKHVLLISVDGLHESDLEWYVSNHPGSELAKLVGGGVKYINARTPFPSDSSPGMVAQATGGDPGVTGVYYDSGYDHNLLPAGTITCTPASIELGFLSRFSA